MKSKLRKIIVALTYNLNYKFLMRNIILFESNPDYSDNAYYVFKECIKCGINNNLKMVWICANYNRNKKYPSFKNVKFINRKNKLLYLYYNFFAKYIVDCNRYIRKMNKNQFRIHLSHSSPVKMLNDYWLAIGKTDYFIAESDEWKNIIQKIYYNTNLVDNIYSCGLPRNDAFSLKHNNVFFFPEVVRDKTILWLPTYRHHKNSKKKNNSYNMTDINFSLGIPCLDSIDDIKKLNKHLNQKNILLIIKPHPAQDLTAMKKIDFSNIRLISDEYFCNFTNLYNYLPTVDALITDYSSVYFDFLYANRPIGLAIPDYQLYTNHVQQPYDYMSTVIGEIILDYNGLIKFVDHVSQNVDVKKEERKKISKKYCYKMDGGASNRVVKILLDKIGDKNEESN